MLPFLYQFSKREYIYKLYSVQFRYNFLNFLHRDNVKAFQTKRKPSTTGMVKGFLWLRRLDLNQRPSGYEGLSAPRKSPTRKEFLNFIKQIMYKSVHFFSKFLKEK